MLARDVDGVLLQCDRGDRAAELVDLEIVINMRATTVLTAVQQKHSTPLHVTQAKASGIRNKVGKTVAGMSDPNPATG